MLSCNSCYKNTSLNRGHVVVYRVHRLLFFPLNFDLLNHTFGFDSGEGIMVINGTGDILEGKGMLDMDMLCHQIRTRACTQQLQLPGFLNLGVSASGVS